MKKVINITLGSIVFAIEQDAYDKLATYLEEIKKNLTNSEDAKEVIDDIESAIAEKFIAHKRSEKIAVISADVEQVMSEMGDPTDFGDGTEGGEATSDAANEKEGAAEVKKRLYRDPDDALIGGVASGLAKYFDIDPVIVRLIFVVSLFFEGIGFIAYIILWMIVPEARTTADKYAMRGERVTLKEISERVKKNIENADLTVTRGIWANVRAFLEKVFYVFGSLIRFLIAIVRYVVGIVLVLGGALCIAGTVSLYSVILLSDKVLFSHDIQIALEALQSSTLGIVALVSFFFMVLIPLMVLITLGTTLLTKRSYFTVQKIVTLITVWIVATAVAGTTLVLQAEQVAQQIGPVEGTFGNSSFRIKWEDGTIYGDETEIYIIENGIERRIEHR